MAMNNGDLKFVNMQADEAINRIVKIEELLFSLGDSLTEVMVDVREDEEMFNEWNLARLDICSAYEHLNIAKNETLAGIMRIVERRLSK